MSGPESKKRIDDGGEDFFLVAAALEMASQRVNDESLVDVARALSIRFYLTALVNSRDGFLFYLARDARANPGAELVLLKIVPPSAGSREVELFELETTAAAKLIHSNIPATSVSQELNGVHFSVVEHRPETETLQALLDREGWVEPNFAIGLAHQMTDALEYAHSLNVLHLRIKPGNILLDSDGTALLTDFGFENRSDPASAVEVRALHSLMPYMSPELASGRPVDERSDLYSLGVVLYQVLTDRLPFAAEDRDSSKERHLTQSALPPHLYRSEVPLPLSVLISRLLERDPAKRFQNVASLRAALNEAFSVRPSADQNPSPMFDEQRPSERSSSSEQADEPSSSSRLIWESPSITVLNAPTTSIAEAGTDSEAKHGERAKGFETIAAVQGSVDRSDERHPDEPALFQTHPVGKPRFRGMIVLTFTVIAALIGLAVAARHKTGNSTSVSPPALEIENYSSGRQNSSSSASPAIESSPADKLGRAGGNAVPLVEHSLAGRNAGPLSSGARLARSNHPHPRAYSTSTRIRRIKRKGTLRFNPSHRRRGSLLERTRQSFRRR